MRRLYAHADVHCLVISLERSRSSFGAWKARNDSNSTKRPDIALTERLLRIFVSSPSDVAGERARVKLVADRLNSELEGIVRLDILRWEDSFYSAVHSFQEAIDAAIGNMTQTDMVLCIVWKRAGLELQSGHLASDRRIRLRKRHRA